MEISRLDYETALSISHDSDFPIHLKRPPDSCLINNYFQDGLLLWGANLDIQPVLNQCKAVTYMSACISKTEDEYSEAIKQTVKDAF